MFHGCVMDAANAFWNSDFISSGFFKGNVSCVGIGNILRKWVDFDVKMQFIVLNGSLIVSVCM
jgi:hypothetical protein